MPLLELLITHNPCQLLSDAEIADSLTASTFVYHQCSPTAQGALPVVGALQGAGEQGLQAGLATQHMPLRLQQTCTA